MANGKRQKNISKLEYDLLVGWAVVQLVGGVGWVEVGRVEHVEGWELHGLVRVV